MKVSYEKKAHAQLWFIENLVFLITKGYEPLPMGVTSYYAQGQ
jgi:hypothetical protein